MTEHTDGPDAGTDATAIVTHSELISMISDFESLVVAGLLHGTRQDAAHFFSGWLSFEDQPERDVRVIREITD